MKKIKLDYEGFLINQEIWNKEVATYIAEKDKIELGEIHWLVIEYLRDYYHQFEILPLVSQINQHLIEKSQNSNIQRSYLYQAFPYGVLKQGAKIAGLSKPPSCL